jgi:hypothetical protein
MESPANLNVMWGRKVPSQSQKTTFLQPKIVAQALEPIEDRTDRFSCQIYRQLE